MAYSEIPIDGYGDETDAHGHYIGSQPLREPTTDAKYISHDMKPTEKPLWTRDGANIEANDYVIKVRNYAAKNSTQMEIALAMAILNFLNGDDDVVKLRQENQRLREALTTIADTVAAAADDE